MGQFCGKINGSVRLEYKVIQERLVKGTIACDLAERYNITTDEVNGMVERFQRLNGMENMHLYQMRKELHKHGANAFKYTHNVT